MMGVTMYATSAKAAQNLLAQGLIGLKLHQLSDHQPLREAAASISGITPHEDVGDGALAVDFGSITAADILAQSEDVAIYVAGSHYATVTVPTTTDRDIASVTRDSVSTLASRHEPSRAPQGPGQRNR